MLPAATNQTRRLQTIAVRPATQDDVPGIFALVNTHALRGSLLPRPWMAIYNTIDDWLVAEAGEEILGCVSLLRYWSGSVEIRSLAVQDRLQGLGIGSRLMDLALKEAKRRHVSTLFALTRAAHFFKNFGFTQLDRYLLTEKIMQDCRFCPLVDRCDETAMMLFLDEAALF
jgi:N-acetylglutamate synthase-like GNAT family acetyltransferase